MLPDRVSNPGPLTYESGALPIALRGPAHSVIIIHIASISAFNLLDGVCIQRNFNGSNTFGTMKISSRQG